MPRIPSRRRKILPSGRVGGVFQPLSTADTGQGIEARGLGALGRGLGRLGQIMGELVIREQRADDLLASDKASVLWDSAGKELIQAKIDNSDPADWDEITNTIANRTRQQAGILEFSDAVAERQGLLNDSRFDDFLITSKIKTTTRKSADAVTATYKSLMAGFETDTPDLKERIVAYGEALANVESPEVVEVLMNEALADGAKKNWISRAVLNPEDIIKDARAKKDSLRAGKLDENGLSAKDFDDIISTAQTSMLRRNVLEQEKFKTTEKELHQAFIDKTLTKQENDQRFELGDSDVKTHKAYDALIKNRDLMVTDDVLAERWLNGTLTETDIKTAQKEGRLKNSTVVGHWLSILNQDKFNVGLYDQALERIRQVKYEPGKYESTRVFLLENAEELGGAKYAELRKALNSAETSPEPAAGKYIQRAHSLVDDYIAGNPEINDGTLESIERVQAIHDAIDARKDQTPQQIRDLTQALLLPYQEEEAKGWFGSIFEAPVVFGPGPGLVLRGLKRIRFKKEKVFQSILRIQPVSKEEFNKTVWQLKGLFGEDSRQAKLFYDKYIGNYDWGGEE